MIYQKLLTGNKPYYLSGIRRSKSFHLHRHPEIEFFYCLKGRCALLVNKVRYELTAGDLLLIGSMNAHEFAEDQGSLCLTVAMEVGPLFLGEYFDPLAKITAKNPRLSLEDPENAPLKALVLQLVKIKKNPDPTAELEGRGLLYQLCARLLRKFDLQEETAEGDENLRAVEKVERALELIYEQYASDLTVEQAAALCGYSKSNFCRVFRRITGQTFHQALNRHRIETACALLKKTDRGIEEIAAETGFSDVKTFCRVFKAEKGCTAGQFRRGQ